MVWGGFTCFDSCFSWADVTDSDYSEEDSLEVGSLEVGSSDVNYFGTSCFSGTTAKNIALVSSSSS